MALEPFEPSQCSGMDSAVWHFPTQDPFGASGGMPSPRVIHWLHHFGVISLLAALVCRDPPGPPLPPALELWELPWLLHSYHGNEFISLPRAPPSASAEERRENTTFRALPLGCPFLVSPFLGRSRFHASPQLGAGCGDPPVPVRSPRWDFTPAGCCG